MVEEKQPEPEAQVVVKRPFGFFGRKKSTPMAPEVKRPAPQARPQPSGDLFGDDMEDELEIPSFLRRQNR
jgi:cell division protein FtsZ